MFKSDDELTKLRARIMSICENSQYDHRNYMPSVIGEKFPHMLEENQVRYARFKLAVAQALQPKTIYEVGVGWGVSALAMMAGCPSAGFYGIDNVDMGVDPSLAVNASLRTERVDSASLQEFVHPDGPIDLIHIDGGHGLEHKADDIVRALRSKPEWILVDDMRNVMVAAGTFAGLYRAHDCPDIHMLYFENSHTGNLLIHADRDKLENRGLEIKRV